jgi:hypothetical protein
VCARSQASASTGTCPEACATSSTSATTSEEHGYKPEHFTLYGPAAHGLYRKGDLDLREGDVLAVNTTPTLE